MLTVLAWTSLSIAFASALIIIVDEVKHPQKMWIMNVVWPVTALYFSVFALWAYFRAGRHMTKDAMQGKSEREMEQHQEQQKQQARRSPSLLQTALADSHCGAGCVLADIVTEFTVFGVGATLLGTELYASYAWDFIAAWLLGIVFQYFTIKPMEPFGTRKLQGCNQSRHAFDPDVPDRNVRLAGARVLKILYAPTPASERIRLLADDTDRDD